MEMNILNNDCLILIFHYLPIVDRIRLERVNKLWYEASHESWHNFKKLEFDNSCWGFKNARALEKVNSRVLKKVLIRCGQFIQSIGFPETRIHRLGPNVLNLLAKHCPNIQCIYAEELEISPWTIRALSERCSKIAYFCIGNCLEDCDDELELLFQNNKNIRALSVHDNFSITGRCLLKLNEEHIESIVFNNCPSLSLKYFSVVKNFKKLSEIVIEHIHDSDNSAVEDISLCSASLKHLTLALCPFYSSSLSHLARLTNLVSLDLLSNVSVNDETLMAVGLNCKRLRRVDVSYCNSITNNGLSSIITLPNLEHLAFEECVNITDEVFEAMPKLKHMDCSHCQNVKDAGLIRLIETSEAIEHLYLSYCGSLSNDLLKAAMRITKRRKNRIILKMHLGNTNVKLSEVGKTSPNLFVVPDIVVNCFSCVSRGFF